MKKKIFLGIVLSFFVAAFLLGTRPTAFDFKKPKENQGLSLAGNALAEAGTKEKFDYLSKQTSSSCSLQRETVLSYSDDARIEGACCSAMDVHRYQEQVEGLKKYSNIPQVPQDPYNIPVTLAKELFGYQQDIQLTPEEQKVYDEAMKMSHEGGPCCCKCWRWTAFEGQAKYLITQHNWASEQIAGLWDMEDGCGGEGHEGHG